MFRFEFFSLIIKTRKFDDRTNEIRLGWGKRFARNFFHNFLFSLPGRCGRGRCREFTSSCVHEQRRGWERNDLFILNPNAYRKVCVCFLCLRRRLLLGARRRRLREPFVAPGEILLRLQQRRLRGVHLLRLWRQRQPF